MNNKLEFLRKYNKSVQIILPNEIDKIDSTVIPGIWLELFEEKDIRK